MTPRVKKRKKCTYFLSFCMNHTTIIPVTKTVKAHAFSAASPTTLTRKPEIAPRTLPTIASNA